MVFTYLNDSLDLHTSSDRELLLLCFLRVISRFGCCRLPAAVYCYKTLIHTPHTYFHPFITCLVFRRRQIVFREVFTGQQFHVFRLTFESSPVR